MNIIEEREKKFKKLMTKEKMMLMKHQADPFIDHRMALNEHYSGIQKEYRFDNGYGASVICHTGSQGGHQGLWELAVTLYGILCYDTVITNDVMGYLTTKDVNKHLQAIKEL
tara:strand:+ start:168 stop:503 length:336 start_codon:yes stop_codon:yes gene_type:complete